MLAALAPGRSVIENPADCDDPRLLATALSQLGVEIDWSDGRITVRGGEPLLAANARVELGNAGTATRLVTGLSLLVEGEMVVDGVPAMRRRPMAGLLGALVTMGVGVEELGRPHCPPLRLRGPAGSGRGEVELDPRGSSQQLSALMLAAARLPEGLIIDLTGHLPSWPYIEMTIETMAAFGGLARWEGSQRVVVEPGGLEPTDYTVEADYSAAAMVLAGAWIVGREVEISGLRPDSCQGDRRFVEVLDQIAGGDGRTIDLCDAPDVTPPAVAAALFARGVTRIEGVGHLRIKECDRLDVLSTELGKLGARIAVEPDALVITPAPLHGGTRLDPAGDHRMAMAFGLVGLRVPGVIVAEPGCVSKSFPDFWDALERLR